MSHRNGPQNLHYHNVIKSTSTSAVYMPSSNIISEPLTDKYTVGENIGRGKFAVVRKCINKETNEVVAAKFIKKRRRGKSCREEILREVVMLEMALEHPRLVNLKEVYETQQELVLITEYCAGGELFTECILEEKFNEADVRLIMAQILEGMAFLHDKNIVHLDLKPQNILLTDEFPKGSIKICDLGFACLVNTGEDIRDIIGTPDYVAPEVLNYDPLGLYTDMWSLGVLTYVMLTTCSPFAGEDSTLTFSNITNVNLDFPDELFADISMAAQDFIQKLLIAEPSERMTAKECFNHKWLSGIESPCKPLTLTGAETPNFTVGENRDTEDNANVTGEAQDVSNITWTDRSLQSSRESSRDDLDEVSRKSFASSRESSRDKIANQPSEMSVIEGKEDEGIGIDSEADIEADELVEIANSTKDSECDTGNTSTIDKSIGDTVTEKSSESSNKDFINEDSAFDNLDLVSTELPEKSIVDTELTPDLITPEIKTPELITPETDSSMCISENKLPETDSGLMTGSECKSVESVDISGRISADQESENIDTDFNSETNDDIEMMNKSSMDVKDMGGGDDSNLSSIVGEDNAGNNTIETKRAFGIISEEMNVTDEVTMSENEMEVDNSLAGSGEKVLQINENNSAKSMANETEHSNYKFNFSSVDNTQMSMDDTTGNSNFTKEQPRDQVGNKTVPTTSFGDFIKDDKYAISPGNVETRGRTSVGGIDDSINSMQLAERHKRGMCNDSTSPGVDKSATDDTEYEFVSVTKRVRSIEDSMATRSPPFSPKIPRSPRITRHSRNNHLQHH